MISVTSLFVYPVKSCRGAALETVALGPSGLENDRRWMIVDETGRFVSQREAHELAAIGTELTPEGLTLTRDTNRFTLPFFAGDPKERPMRAVTVWSASFEAYGYPAAAGIDAWLSDVLGRTVHFVEDAGLRRLKEKHHEEGFHDRVAFADAFPLLLLSEESVADLNDRIRTRSPAARDLPMNRFRPNIVVAGGGAYVEDAHPRFRIGETTFLADAPCARCVITTIDQETLAVAKEPLATLATYRKQDGEVMFGQNLRIATLSKESGSNGCLRVGDRVTPL